MTPRVNIILKQDSCGARRQGTLTQKMTTTWLQELATAPPEQLQESRKRTALPFNTKNDRNIYFHSLMKEDVLQMFRNNSGPTRENLGENLADSRRKYIKLQSMATGKHEFRKLVFNPANQRLVDILAEGQKLARDAFGIAAHANAIIEQIIYTRMPPHLKKSIDQDHMENGRYDHNVTHLNRELELNGLKASDELQINYVTHTTANRNAARPKPKCHHCKKLGHYQNQCRLL